MSEWKSYKLGEIAELRKEQIIPNGIEQPYIGLEHIEQQSLRLNDVGSSNSVISNKFKFYSGDILYGKLRPYFRKVYQPKFDGVCSTDIYVIKNKKPVERDFLYYLIATEEFTNIANSGSSGTRMPRADWNQLQNSEWLIPDLPTQRQIAQILSSLDDKIELNLQMNQTLEAMAQAIFKEWFVNFNFPGFDGELENGLPKRWRMGKLGEVVSFVKGVSYRSSELVPSKFALVTLKSFNRFGGLNYGGFKEFFGKYKETQVLNEGDVIIAQTDITQAAEVIGCPAIVENPFKYEKLIASIDIVKCVPINIHFSEAVLFYFLNDKRFKDFCLSHTNGSTVLHLRSSALPNFEFPIPDNELLKQFTEIINPIREKIISNNKQIQSLTQTRDTLLPKLMSGKISLNCD